MSRTTRQIADDAAEHADSLGFRWGTLHDREFAGAIVFHRANDAGESLLAALDELEQCGGRILATGTFPRPGADDAGRTVAVLVEGLTEESAAVKSFGVLLGFQPQSELSAA